VLFVCKVYSEIALPRKPFRIGHMYIYIYTFLLRMTDFTTSQNIELSSWDTRYLRSHVFYSMESIVLRDIN
jgi:hypothetical protein